MDDVAQKDIEKGNYNFRTKYQMSVRQYTRHFDQEHMEMLNELQGFWGCGRSELIRMAIRLIAIEYAR